MNRDRRLDGDGAEPAVAAAPVRPSQPTPVAVPPEGTSSAGAKLGPAAAVSGTVAIRTGSQVVPFQGRVAAFAGDPNRLIGLGSTTTGPDGSFLLTGLSSAGVPGGVHICVYPDSADSPHWYGGCAGAARAWDGNLPVPGVAVSLQGGQVTGGVNVQVLSRPSLGWGSIVMKVRGRDGTVGTVPRIAAFDVHTGRDVIPFRNQGDPGWNLLAGDYRICAIGRTGPARTGYQPTCVGNVTWFQASARDWPGHELAPPKSATIVHVLANQTLALTVTEPIAATLDGVVRESRAPHAVVAGAVVRLWHGTRLVRQGNARFHFNGLPTGRYTLCAGGSLTMQGKGSCWRTGAWKPSDTAPRGRATLVLAAGHHYTRNLRLDGGFGRGAVSGAVSGAQGRPLRGVRVTLYGPGDKKRATVLSGHRGTFRFGNLIAFRSTGYKIYFDPAGLRHFPHVPVFYRNSQSERYATVVQVRPGRTTSGIKQLLSNGEGGIGGTVTGTGDVPVAGVKVTVTRVGAGGVPVVRTATTNRRGAYFVGHLRSSAPAYTVCFDPSAVSDQPPTGYARQCYDGAPWSYDLEP